VSHSILTADTIHELYEGRAGAMIDTLFRKATLDILDRIGEAKPRKVTLTFIFTPKRFSDGSVDRIDIQVKGKPSIPDYSTGNVDAALKATGGVIFSSENSDNVDQATFDYPKES